jgi:cullin-associated NEDD8-dissociated protein 1
MHTGAALNSMLEFFQALVKAGLPGLGYRDLLSMLVTPVTQGRVGESVPVLHKQVC